MFKLFSAKSNEVKEAIRLIRLVDDKPTILLSLFRAPDESQLAALGQRGPCVRQPKEGS
jgi:hypothetical protein